MNIPAIIALMRPRQWVKNGFVLAPIFFGAKLLNLNVLGSIALAVACFCLVSSAVYAVNDLCDAEADRLHVKKRLRPIASGAVKPREAVSLSIVLTLAAIALALAGGLAGTFYLAMAAYVLINLSYSLGLKHVAILELFLVSSGFVIRLLAGSAVGHIALSPWIVVATGLISLLLAAGKRRADLAQQNDQQMLRRSLRGYTIEFLDIQLGAIAGAVMVVYVLFCASDHAIQRYGPYVLLTTVPVAMGVIRFLQLVIVRGRGDSPTDLVMRDPFILSVVSAFLAIFVCLIYLTPRLVP